MPFGHDLEEENRVDKLYSDYKNLKYDLSKVCNKLLREVNRWEGTPPNTLEEAWDRSQCKAGLLIKEILEKNNEK